MDNKYNALISYSHSADMDLAEALEKGLEKFAKPTFRRRALHIFRDSNDLSVSPDLWGKIEEGLDQSEYFICLASPGHAKSHYCGEEVKHWLATKGIDNFLIVLTGGELQWDFNTSDFDWEKTTAVSKLLSGVFKNEPLYVDFRDEIPKDQMNLDNPVFKEKLVYIAATIHGRAVGDMVGEAVKQHKRTLLIRNTAVALIMTFMAVSLFLSILSNRRKDASVLHFQAMAMENQDPTLALRLEEEALKIHDYPEYEKSALKNIGKNAFYKILAENDSIVYNTLSVSPADGTFLSGGSDGIVRILDQQGELVREIKAHEKEITTTVFMPEGKSFLTGSLDGLRHWDLEGNLLLTFNLPGLDSFAVKAVDVSPDGHSILIGSSAGAHILNRNGELIQTLQELPVSSLTFTPDGNGGLIALEGGKDVMSLFDLQGQFIHSFENYGYSFGEAYNITNSVVVSPDKQHVLTASFDDTAALWDLNGRLLQVYNKPIPGGLSKSKAIFSPDGQYVLTASMDHSVRIWDLKGNLMQELKGHQAEILYMAIFDDGRSAMTTSTDGTMRKWNLSGAKAEYLNSFKGQGADLTDLVISPDGNSILTANNEGNAYLWDLSGTLLQEFDGHEAAINSMHFSPNGKQVITASEDKKVIIWEIGSENLFELGVHPAGVLSVTSSTDGTALATLSSDGTGRIYNTNGLLLEDFELGGNDPSLSPSIDQITISMTSNRIITSSFQYISIWNFKGDLLNSFEIPGSALLRGIKSLAFSPDGQSFLSGSTDGIARLWDLEGNVLQEFFGPGQSANLVAFSPDGQTLVTTFGALLDNGGYLPGVARLWDVEGNLLMEFEHDGTSPNAVAVSADNKAIFTLYTSKNEIVQYRTVPLEEYIDFFLKHYVEPLSTKQQLEYGVD